MCTEKGAIRGGGFIFIPGFKGGAREGGWGGGEMMFKEKGTESPVFR